MRGQGLYFVRGGTLVTYYQPKPLEVVDFVREAKGVAGINGAFFNSSNRMVGPMLSSVTGRFSIMESWHVPLCIDRPLVLLAKDRAAFLPLRTNTGPSISALDQLLPGTIDAFLGGAWLVRNSVPEPETAIRKQAVGNAMEVRHRAVMGVDKQGRPVIVATGYDVDSATLAKDLMKLDLQEAVLLDSGYSTSLVWRENVLVNGGRIGDRGSRAVPHALILR